MAPRCLGISQSSVLRSQPHQARTRTACVLTTRSARVRCCLPVTAIRPSDTLQRGAYGALSTEAAIKYHVQSATIGMTWSMTSHLTDELRLNWSRTLGSSSYINDDFGGATPLPASIIDPASANAKSASLGVFAGSTFLWVGGERRELPATDKHSRHAHQTIRRPSTQIRRGCAPVNAHVWPTRVWPVDILLRRTSGGPRR